MKRERDVEGIFRELPRAWLEIISSKSKIGRIESFTERLIMQLYWRIIARLRGTVSFARAP